MSNFRYIIALAGMCVSFVILAAALRFTQFPSIADTASAEDAVTSGTTDLSTDGAFYTATTSPQAAASAALASADAAVSTTSISVTNVPQVSGPQIASVPVAPVDPISAEAYIVGDVATGKIYLEKNASEVLPFASMSKLITAIAATDTYKPTDLITILPPNVMVPPDGSNLQAGEQFTVKELLYPLLLDSSNVAGEAFATHVDRSKFLESMSGYAWEIGMPNAFFADPTGLSEKNAGTAGGFFNMARYLYNSRPDILQITRTPLLAVATTTLHGAHQFASIHPFVNDPRFLGGKTGHTDIAEDTMLTIMSLKGHPIAIIVLHSNNQRQQDTQYLIDKVSGML